MAPPPPWLPVVKSVNLHTQAGTPILHLVNIRYYGGAGEELNQWVLEIRRVASRFLLTPLYSSVCGRWIPGIFMEVSPQDKG